MKTLAYLFIIVLAGTATAETVTWEGTPIQVALMMGQERRIDLPQPVRWQPLDAAVEITSFDSTVLIRATDAVSARLTLQEIQSGRIILLDLYTTSRDITDGPLKIQRASQSVAEPLSQHEDPKVALTRYVAQQFYAPPRLRTRLPGATRIGVARQSLEGVYRHGALALTPIAAWRYAGLTLTACRVENRTSETVTWDPRQLRGSWVAATVQHPRLGPRDSGRAQTVAYLIHRQSDWRFP